MRLIPIPKILSGNKKFIVTVLTSFFLCAPSHALFGSLASSPAIIAVGAFFTITGPMKIDWDNKNTAHRDWGLFAFGIVLMDTDTGLVQFHPLTPEDRPETYNLTQEEFTAYKKEWYLLNVLINEIASKNFPLNDEGVELAKAEWRRYISQGTISQNTLSAAAKIMHVSFLE